MCRSTTRTCLQWLMFLLLLDVSTATIDGHQFDPETNLGDAASATNLNAMKRLIAQGADPNLKDRFGRTPLVEAVGAKDVRAVELLLAAGARPDDAAMSQASMLGRMEAVQLLLQAGANPDAGIVSAALGGHVEIVKLLLEKGANVNAQSKEGSIALHAAASQGGFKTVQFLLQHGANSNVINHRGETPLHRAVSGDDDDLQTVQLLVESGAKFDIANEEGITPVRLAGVRGNRAVYEWLVKASGGKEPRPARTDAANEMREKSTAELIATLASRSQDNLPVQKELVLRGKNIVPEVLQSIESGARIERFYSLFAALGPAAEPALPKLEELLGDKNKVFGTVLTMRRMMPHSLERLPLESRERAAATLYEAAIAELSGGREPFSVLMLASLGEISIPHLLKLLRSENPKIRRLGAISLEAAAFSSDEITSELISMLQTDKDPVVRAAAARELGDFGQATAEVKAALLAAAKDAPPLDAKEPDHKKREEAQKWRKVSYEAAGSLARLGPKIIEDLMPMLATPRKTTQNTAAMAALNRLGEKGIPRLMELLDHRDPAIANSASVALGRIGRKAIPELIEALRSDKAQVVQRAADALWGIRRAKAALPALLEVAGSVEQSDASRLRAMRAALRIDPEESREAKAIPSLIPVLLRALEKGDLENQSLAAEVAHGIGPEARQALPALRRIVDTDVPETERDQSKQRSDLRQKAEEAISAIAAGSMPESE